MSGYCPDCGNTFCVCALVEAEAAYDNCLKKDTEMTGTVSDEVRLWRENEALRRERDQLKAEVGRLRLAAESRCRDIDALDVEINRLNGLLGWKQMGAQVSPSPELFEALREHAERLADALRWVENWGQSHVSERNVALLECVQNALTEFRAKCPKETDETKIPCPSND